MCLKKNFINIQFSNVDHTRIPKKNDFLNWVNTVLNYFNRNGEITIRIVDKKESQFLNMTYRKKNQPTNILSFKFENIFSSFPYFLGDLVICSELIEEEANIQKKKLINHWSHIVIHGCLHLLGFNHIKEFDAREMEKIEKKIMLLLKLSKSI